MPGHFSFIVLHSTATPGTLKTCERPVSGVFPLPLRPTCALPSNSNRAKKAGAPKRRPVHGPPRRAAMRGRLLVGVTVEEGEEVILGRTTRTVANYIDGVEATDAGEDQTAEYLYDSAGRR